MHHATVGPTMIIARTAETTNWGITDLCFRIPPPQPSSKLLIVRALQQNPSKWNRTIDKTPSTEELLLHPLRALKSQAAQGLSPYSTH